MRYYMSKQEINLCQVYWKLFIRSLSFIAYIPEVSLTTRRKKLSIQYYSQQFLV